LVDDAIRDDEVVRLNPNDLAASRGCKKIGNRFLNMMNLLDAIWLLLLSAVAKFAGLIDGKVEGSRPDNKIQSSRSPRSAPIDEG
jgi:hypothetical protein